MPWLHPYCLKVELSLFIPLVVGYGASATAPGVSSDCQGALRTHEREELCKPPPVHSTLHLTFKEFMIPLKP